MTHHPDAVPHISKKAKSLTGKVKLPGDKSISHRAVMFGMLAEGMTRVHGLLEGEDVMRTAEVARMMGAEIGKDDDGSWTIRSPGANGLTEPTDVLNMGNSGTSTRLLMGLLAGFPMTFTMTGDASLVKRPMGRVINPLTEMGASFMARGNGLLPLTMKGSAALKPVTYKLPVASAQVKSAVLLAGIRAAGKTTVIEERPTRDHTEAMLVQFGYPCETETLDDGSYAISVDGHASVMKGQIVHVPADTSSGAFLAAAAALVDGSDVTLESVSLNPRRAGFYTVLKEMGADIQFENLRDDAGEKMADIRVRGGKALQGVDVPPEIVPSMIDEFPVFSMVAACAKGTTKMTGLAELRVKESDRLDMVARGLQACGVKLEEGEESLTIFGIGEAPKGGAMIETALDHRIAMAFLVLGMVSEEPVRIDDANPIKTSFPDFISLMNSLGADLAPDQASSEDNADGHTVSNLKQA